jgi:hypothetical protein
MLCEAIILLSTLPFEITEAEVSSQEDSMARIMGPMFSKK